MKFKRIISAAVCAALLLAPIPISAQAQEEIPNGYALAAQSKELRLYANPKTGNFCIADNARGGVWHSAAVDAEQNGELKGAVKNRLMSFVSGTLLQPDTGKETPFYSSILAGQGKLEYTALENGYSIQVNVQDISFSVEVRLEGGAVAIKVPNSSIREEKTYLQSLQLAPFFGAANENDKGYLLIPDGCGAIVEFNSGIKGTYDEPVYSVDKAVVRQALALTKQSIALPVYGIEKNSRSVLAVISSGAAAASIQAASFGNGTPYNTVGASFTLREKASQSITGEVSQTIYEPLRSVQADLELTLIPASGGWLGMADTLKAYLANTYNVKESAKNGPAGLVSIIAGESRQAKLLGVPVWNEPKPLTSFERAGEIAQRLGSGSSIALELLAWDTNQILGKHTASPSPAGCLGAKAGFERLAKSCARLNIPLYAGVSAAEFAKSGGGVNIGADAIRTLTQEPAAQFSFYPASFAANYNSAKYLLSPALIKAPLTSFAEKSASLGTSGISVTDIAQMSYSDYRSKKPINATEGEKHLQDALSSAAEKGALSVHGGFMYSLPYADLVINAPTASSAFAIQKQEVPFYQAALSGLLRYAAPSVNLQAAPRKAALKAISTGSLISFTFADTGVYFAFDAAQLKDTGISWQFGGESAVLLAQEFFPVSEKTAGQKIVLYEQAQSGLYITRFENNMVLAVNYNDKAISHNGREIQPLGFYLWEKG